MKAFITPTYTFTPGASGVGTVEITTAGFSLDIKRLVAIINQTQGVVIYATASPALKYTNVVGNVVTLNYDTTGMLAADKLQIIYELTGLQSSSESSSVIISPDQAAIPTYSSTQGGTVLTERLVVGTVAVEAKTVLSPGGTRSKLIIKANQDNTGRMWVGGADVTTANGLELIGPDRFEVNNNGSSFYVISDTAGQTVEILEI